MKLSQLLHLICAVLFLLGMGGANFAYAQETQPKKNNVPKTIASAPVRASKVARVDFAGLQAVLKQNAADKRPLLVNFWATWCPPCREEFPDLVKIDAEFRPQGLDFFTVSLDDLADIESDVPKFLAEMKATMPAYLLKTADEEAAIHAIAPDWRGALPLTVLYDASGKAIYTKMGAVKPEILKTQIENLLKSKYSNSTSSRKLNGEEGTEVERINALAEANIEQVGKEDAEKDIIAKKFIIKDFSFAVFSWASYLKKDYGVDYQYLGSCETGNNIGFYVMAYNNVVITELKRRFGDDIIEKAQKIESQSFPNN